MADPVSLAISIGISLTMSAVSYLLQPKPKGQNVVQEGMRQTEFSLAGGSSYGAAIPVVYGRARLPANLVWMSEVRETRRTTVYSQTVDSKKDSVTNTQTVVEYFYKCDFVVQLCQGPITGGIVKIFADKQLVYSNLAGEDSVAFKFGSFTLYKGTASQTLPSPVPTNYRDTVVVLFEDFDMTFFGNRLPIIEIEISENGAENPSTLAITPAAVSAATIIEDICQRVGMTPTDYYIGDITAEFLGYATPQGPLVNALTPVVTAAKAVSIYSDDKIKFRGRAVDPVVIIPAADLRYIDADSGGEDGAALLMVRADEQTLPSKVTAEYIDPTRDHDKNTQSALHNNARYRNEQSISFGISMTGDEAARLAEVFLYTAWQERIRYHVVLGPKYIYLEPGDAIQVQTAYATVTMQILRLEYGANGVISIDAVSYNRGTLVSNKTGADWSVNNPGDPAPTDTAFQYFNAPMIDPAQNGPGVFVFCNGVTPSAWSSSQLYISRNAIDYQLKDVVGVPGFFGTTLDVLADHPAQYVDVINSVDIVINDGELTSTTLEELLADQRLNLFFLGDELVQAANVTLIASNTYRLSTLLRGRFGTERYTASHTAGEKIAVYGTGFYMALNPSSDYATPLYFKAVSNGQKYSDIVTIHALTADFRTLMPYGPVNVDAAYDAGDIVITWRRRSRYGDEFPTTGAEVPLFEASEQYQVEIIDYNSNNTVRWLTVTEQSARYTIAEQAADGFSGLLPFVCIVYQLSEMVGRGHPSPRLEKQL